MPSPKFAIAKVRPNGKLIYFKMIIDFDKSISPSICWTDRFDDATQYDSKYAARRARSDFGLASNYSIVSDRTQKDNI